MEGVLIGDRETIGMLRRTLARLDVTSRTLFALVDGKVEFRTKGKEKRKFVSVIPAAA